VPKEDLGITTGGLEDQPARPMRRRVGSHGKCSQIAESYRVVFEQWLVEVRGHRARQDVCWAPRLSRPAIPTAIAGHEEFVVRDPANDGQFGRTGLEQQVRFSHDDIRGV
jgi:hypothetical protein